MSDARALLLAKARQEAEQAQLKLYLDTFGRNRHGRRRAAVELRRWKTKQAGSKKDAAP